MAEYTTRIETTSRLIIALALPTNWAEVQKAINAMHQEMAERGVNLYDDTVSVEADEDELRLDAVIGGQDG